MMDAWVADGALKAPVSPFVQIGRVRYSFTWAQRDDYAFIRE